MGLFSSNKPAKAGPAPEDLLSEIAWSKSDKGKWRRFAFIKISKENITDVSGVFLIWHGGVRPGWVYCGYGVNLAMELMQAKDNAEIMEHELSGGLFVTWFPCAEGQAKKISLFLQDTLDPLIENAMVRALKGGPFLAVVPPGYTKDSFIKVLRLKGKIP